MSFSGGQRLSWSRDVKGESRDNPLRVFSFGGGTQSMAVLALQALGQLPQPYDAFVFANVGADSENPATLDYLAQYAQPFAQAHHIRLETVQKTRRTGRTETILESIYSENRSVAIPAYMGKSGAPGNRSCTQDWKIIQIDKFIKTAGAKFGVVGVGISVDEWQRARDEDWHDRHGKKLLHFWRRREHPLLALRLSRSECSRIIQQAGLPQPPKSSCWFCPFHRLGEWAQMKRSDPELFARAVDVERQINEKRDLRGKDRLFLRSDLKPIEETNIDQMPLFPDDPACESGYCMT
jgi:hypothetical protein